MAENGDEEIGDHTDKAMRIVGARQASDTVSPDPRTIRLLPGLSRERARWSSR